MEGTLNEDFLWDEQLEAQEPEQNDEPKEAPAEEPKESDYLTKLLQDRGVDKNRVRIENEDGDIEEWNFEDLDDETKYGILSGSESPLNDNEVQDLNFLRSNKMNLKDFAEYTKKMAIQEYLEQNSDKSYTVDKLSDDELFKFDLLEQMPDLTEEEVEAQLENVKQNPTFFEKKIAALRKEYIDLENEQAQRAQQEEEKQKEAQFNELAQSLVSAARSTDEIQGMILDDNDKEEILSFLLDRDANDQTQFYKMFSDPSALFKLAWFALKGDQAYQAMSDYYKSEIAKARKANQPQKQTKVIKKSPAVNQSDIDPYNLDDIFKRK